ncbi:MAG: O-antigen ligase family protein [Chloroflexi bacterium]|nr:O-antigen ligase family protein [Chloroflexota bacterium]
MIEHPSPRPWPMARPAGGESFYAVTATVLLMAVSALALAYLPLAAATFLLAGVLVALLTLVKIEFACYLLAFAVPFGSLKQFPFGPLVFTVADLLVALLVVAWTAQTVAQKRNRVEKGPLFLPIVLFLLAQTLSLLDAAFIAGSAKEMAKWLEFAVVYLVAINTLSAEQIKRVVVCLLLAGIAQGLQGWAQFFLRLGPPSFQIGERFLRAYGTFNQPNPYGGFLNLTLPVAYSLLVWGNLKPETLSPPGLRRYLPGFARSWTLLQVICATALGIMGAALLMTLSRGAWLGFAVAFVAMHVLESRRSLAIFALVSLLVAAVLFLGVSNLLPATLVARAETIAGDFGVFDARTVKVTDENWAVVERMAHWQAALGMLAASPITGVGIGNYEAAYPAYALPGWEDPLGHAHNYYLNIAAETGLVGLGAYLALLATAFGLCWWAQRRSVSSFARALAVGTLGALVAQSTHNLFDNLWVHGMWTYAGLLLGMVHAAQGHHEKPGGDFD